jgi:hypothetical protein
VFPDGGTVASLALSLAKEDWMNWITRSAAALILVMAACGGEPTVEGEPTAEYGSIDQIRNAMKAAGYECVPNGAGGSDGGRIDFGCDWPPSNHPEYPPDYISLLIFSTEQDRLQWMVRTMTIGCGALPSLPDSISYIHGSTWAVTSEYAESPLEVMAALAEGIFGEATSTNCEQLVERLFGPNATGDLVLQAMQIPLEDRSVADLKALLGET